MECEPSPRQNPDLHQQRRDESRRVPEEAQCERRLVQGIYEWKRAHKGDAKRHVHQRLDLLQETRTRWCEDATGEEGQDFRRRDEQESHGGGQGERR